MMIATVNHSSSHSGIFFYAFRQLLTPASYSTINLLGICQSRSSEATVFFPLIYDIIYWNETHPPERGLATSVFRAWTCGWLCGYVPETEIKVSTSLCVFTGHYTLCKLLQSDAICQKKLAIVIVRKNPKVITWDFQSGCFGHTGLYKSS